MKLPAIRGYRQLNTAKITALSLGTAALESNLLRLVE